MINSYATRFVNQFKKKGFCFSPVQKNKTLKIWIFGIPVTISPQNQCHKITEPDGLAGIFVYVIQ
ncbi:MAG: hypothetical protein A2W90_17760 [Bacteroidetes bacterium GWF2_42_66]|nr:MAG: hypothetical protein A2W89_09250 [Bacteroidetes bacterium GWE2_42_39]OFY42485.1 MAG: hypothetical protein A2W90_17760 [Bacteroidetes bacterium GWF2_42_66]HBL74199.1 hypothetical protein [Prolixibacteraceae bacterium]HCR91684.1 hypothetical protein [Prolixibacteraceae bacterium]HCU63968.1 hypothetical protein [Prolixibacteraceae bacterium]